MTAATEPPTAYVPDYRLGDSYEQASRIDAAGLEALCPSYLELTAEEPRYTGAELLGRGATKEVFRSFDTRTKRWVAIARLRPDHGLETYDRFIHEAWINSSLNHPNIIGIHDLGVAEDGRPFFTMDLKGGSTLADLVRSAQPPALHELLGIMIKVCDAVAYAHSRHTLHLDLKPENIQAQAFGEVLVCDWELGRITGGDDEQAGPPPDPGGLPLGDLVDSHSLTGEIKGTPGFMAPEQAQPGGHKDARTDVFALGCILHVILTGESPLRGVPHEEQLARTRAADFGSPRRRFPQRLIPASLEAIFRRATARDPDECYASVAALRNDLANYLAGYATAAEQAGFLREAALLVRRNRLSTAILLLALVALTVTSVLFVQKLDQQALQTRAEKSRAATLANRTIELQNLFQQQSAESKKSARNLAESIAGAANSMKNLGIFTDPVKAIDEAGNLIAMALLLDPTCDAASVVQLNLKCLTLDFRAVLASPAISDEHPLPDFCEIARIAPDFAFNRSSRPSAGQLAGFLRAASAVRPERGPMIERAISYDVAARTDFTGYPEVVGALLAYVNPGWSEAGFQYDPATKELALSSTIGLQLVISRAGGSGKCLLRLTPVYSLRAAIVGPVDFAGLDQMPIIVLDIQDCPQASFSGDLSLPLLSELYVHQGAFDPDALHRRIQAARPFRIIEVP